MITLISNSGEGCPIFYQMQEEGYEVQVYLHNPLYTDNYKKMLKHVTLSDLPAAVKSSTLVIVDMVRLNEGYKRDTMLLRLFNLPTDEMSVFGPVSDKIQEMGIPVIGSSRWTDKIELDRNLGEKIAQKVGISTPVTYNFTGLKEAQNFLENKKSLWVLKPHNNMDLDLTYVESYPGELYYKLDNDIRNRIKHDKVEVMLQKKVEGVTISTEGWFDGQDFVHFNHTIEDKAFMVGDLGPHVGSQGNTVWAKKNLDGLLVSNLERVCPLLREANYVGPIDVNCIVAEKNNQPYFLEWTPRFGYDALYCMLAMIKSKVGEFFENRFDVPIDNRFWAVSQRLSIPPYPYDTTKDLKKMCKDVEIYTKAGARTPDFWMEDVYWTNDGLKCAGADGILGAVVGLGFSIGEASNNCRKYLKELKVGSYKQYRTDAGESGYSATRKLDSMGIQIY